MDKFNSNTTNTFNFNLKGFIVGNGVTNWKYDGDPSLLKIGYYFGLYGMELEQ